MCEHVLTSTFAILSVGYRVISCRVKTSTSTEQKLDELKELFSTSMLALKQSHEESRISMGTEISKLKEDLTTAKEFNQQVRGNITAASRQLGKLESTGDCEKAVIDRDRNELLEGAPLLWIDKK